MRLPFNPIFALTLPLSLAAPAPATLKPRYSFTVRHVDHVYNPSGIDFLYYQSMDCSGNALNIMNFSYDATLVGPTPSDYNSMTISRTLTGSEQFDFSFSDGKDDCAVFKASYNATNIKAMDCVRDIGLINCMHLQK